MEKYYYLLIDFFTILFPFLLSFDKKVAFYKWWLGLFIGIFVNLVLFVLWDTWFTQTGVWRFNPTYVWPFRMLLLPIEEWLFFIVVPYCSIFIYACLKAYTSDKWWQSKTNFFNYLFIVFCLLSIALFSTKTYTVVNFSIALVVLLYQQFIGKGAYMGYFWMAYFVHLIPFFIVNGVLTGFVTPEPVVIYSETEIIGIRLGTIPIEDGIYALTCLLLPITILEKIRTK